MRTAPAALVLCFLLVGSLSAAAPSVQPFTFSWNAVSGAGGYLIEVADPAGRSVFTEKVGSKVHQRTVRLIPGRYRLRMTTLNRFLRAERATDWVSISIQALRPPVFVGVRPNSMVTGHPQSLTLTANELAADATAVVVTPSNQDARAKVKRVSQSDFALVLPPLDEPGQYAVVITNPPDLATKVPAAFSVTFPVPVIERIQPDMISADQVPAVIRLTGREFSQHARVSLRPAGAGAGIALTVKSTQPDSISLELPAGLGPGSYALELTNEPGQSPVTASLQRVTIVAAKAAVVVRTPSPLITKVTPNEIETGVALTVTVGADHLGDATEATVTSPSGVGIEITVRRISEGDLAINLPPLTEAGAYRIALKNPAAKETEAPGLLMVRRLPAVLSGVAPQLIKSNLAAVDVTLSGSRFQPTAHVFLVSADAAREPIPLEIKENAPGSITATIPAGLDPGTYSVSLINDPDAPPQLLPGQHVTILQYVAPVAAGRRLLLSAKWLLAVPLGDWGAVYPVTPIGVDAQADYFLTPHPKVRSGSEWDFALGLDFRLISLSNGTASSFVPSTFLNLALSIDPSVTWSLPFLSVTARLGAGAAYSIVEGSSQTISSFDLAVISELEIVFPITDAFRLGASAAYEHLFLAHPMDLIGGSAFASFNF